MTGPVSPDRIAAARAIDLRALVAVEVRLERFGRGRWRGLCPFHVERTPSFQVYADGHYHCYGCGAHGDTIAWMMARRGVSFREAVELLTGPAPAEDDHQARARAERDRARRAEAEARDRQDRADGIRRARALWRRARRLDDAAAVQVGEPGVSAALAYLAARGVPLDGDLSPARGVLRAVAALPWHDPARRHPSHGETFPALLAPIQHQGHAAPDGPADGTGAPMLGVHRTWIAPGGRGKAPVAPAKKMLGPARGGAIRLARARETLYLAEGIETALSVMCALGPGTAAWAAGSLNALGAVELPPVVRRVVLCADADQRDMQAARDQVNAAAIALADRHGVEVRIGWAAPGADFNDMIRGAA